MADPLFNGAPIFGPSPHVRGWVNPPARVTRGFAGVAGLFTKTLGVRGTEAEAHGIIAGIDEGTQSANEFVFYDLLALGTKGLLVDTINQDWPDMILVDFEPGPTLLFDIINGFHRPYRARFVGLTNP